MTKATLRLKMRRYKVIIGVGAGLLTIIATGLLFLPGLLLPVFSFGGCTTSEQAKEVSPDGHHIASRIFKDCSATEGSEWIALRNADKPIDSNEDGAVFYVSSRMRNISFHWAGPKTLIIRYEDMSVVSDPDYAYYKSWPRLNHWQDIGIIFQKAMIKQAKKL